MKKLGVILLILIYTNTALGGVIINFHYCSGHLAHISFLNFGGKSGCTCNPKAMPKDCCKDEFLYKKTDNHRTIQEFYTFNTISFTPDLSPANVLHNNFIQEGVYDADNFYTDVRRSYTQPIYLLTRAILI